MGRISNKPEALSRRSRRLMCVSQSSGPCRKSFMLHFDENNGQDFEKAEKVCLCIETSDGFLDGLFEFTRSKERSVTECPTTRGNPGAQLMTQAFFKHVLRMKQGWGDLPPIVCSREGFPI
jgi:hypothetical protein